MHKPGIPIVCASFLVATIATGAQVNDPQKTESQAQLVATAVITKIDSKKNTLKVRGTDNGQADRTQNPQGTRRRSGSTRGGGGIGFPGGGRRGGRSRDGGVGLPPTTGGGTRQNSGPEYKVTIRNNTVLKDGDNTIAFGDFRVGDHILVTGVHNGSATDLDATEIVRNPARDR